MSELMMEVGTGPAQHETEEAEPLLFLRGRKGRRGASLPEWDVPKCCPEVLFESEDLRVDIDGFPELGEPEVVRHFTRISQWNYGVDGGFYPLGSCTMKYNPKIHEEIASLSCWKNVHPYVPEENVQGCLQILFEMENLLKEIGGMDACTLQPAAGAHGELTGMMIIRAYHEKNGDSRSRVLIPDTAHGTNPASAALCGYEVVEVPSGMEGILEPELLGPYLDERVAAIMVTNPNTLGLFERHIAEIAQRVHGVGGLVYCDGANLNAIVGTVRPGDTGVDVLHFNLHKTFSTPHGGGGPGAGPLAVKQSLEPFLPVPRLQKENGGFRWEHDLNDSIGRVRSFYGNFGVILRAYLYIRSLGAEGLRRISQISVLNANYLQSTLKDAYHIPYPARCMHECVFTDKRLVPFGVNTMDIAKRLIDLGFHPPTIYFPLVVSGALMIEPTETETKEELDRFCSAMLQIVREAKEEPHTLKNAPTRTRLSRLDEVQAARRPRLRWKAE
jgi:glycine dehydrogenase subunit 2